MHSVGAGRPSGLAYRPGREMYLRRGSIKIEGLQLVREEYRFACFNCRRRRKVGAYANVIAEGTCHAA